MHRFYAQSWEGIMNPGSLWGQRKTCLIQGKEDKAIDPSLLFPVPSSVVAGPLCTVTISSVGRLPHSSLRVGTVPLSSRCP